VDRAFESLRAELARPPLAAIRSRRGRFEASSAVNQRDGLAWLRFLERTRFGGCLAATMGLGKNRAAPRLPVRCRRRHGS